MRIGLDHRPLYLAEAQVSEEQPQTDPLGHSGKTTDIYDLDLDEVKLQDRLHSQFTVQPTGAVCIQSQHCTGTCAGVCDRC